MNELLRCTGCGGAVIWDAAQSGAACLFCGSLSVELHMLAEPLPVPDEVLPLTVTAEQADRGFRSWARRSWFRPPGLDAVELGLRPMLLPAWRVHATLETHWAGLREANTRSGRAPVANVTVGDRTTMVPASAGLTQAELHELQPFDLSCAQPWSSFANSSDDLIWEPPVLTRRGARVWARRELAAAHRQQIMREHRLTRCRVSVLVEQHDARLLLVPIYIGVFRFRERPWRCLIHGQTGAVIGDAPVDRRKLAAIVVVLLTIAALLLCRHLV